MAWAWWLIMPDMKSMSAFVYGSRALSARARAIAASGPITPTAEPCDAPGRPVAQAAKATRAVKLIFETNRVMCPRTHRIARGQQPADGRRSTSGCAQVFRRRIPRQVTQR